jgi:hypothetical protein
MIKSSWAISYVIWLKIIDILEPSLSLSSGFSDGDFIIFAAVKASNLMSLCDAQPVV